MMSTSWCSTIIVLTIITFKSANCDRCRSWTSRTPNEAEYHCYEESNDICSGPDIANLIPKEYRENGTVNIEFDYEPNCKYTLELTRWPQINGICSEKDEDGVFHSQYTYSGVSDSTSKNLQNCAKKGIITLKYVNKGCYHVKLEKKDYHGNFVARTSSKHQFFKLFDDGKLNFLENQSNLLSKGHLQSTDGGMYFEIKHPFLKQYPNLKLEIKSLDGNNICKKYPCGFFKFSPLSSSPSESSEKVKYIYCKANRESGEDIGIDCSVENSYLKCSFKYLDNGNYSVHYYLKNMIQCSNRQPSFFVPCEGLGRINTAPPKSEKVKGPPPKKNEIFFVFVGLGCAGVVLIIVLVIFRLKNNGKHNKVEEPKIYPDKKPPIGQSEVLLLYAKDTDIVMETMKSFRTALKAEGLTVYDLYDTEQQKLICEYNEKWIRDILLNKNMKIVIVQTYCGQILLRSSLPAEKLYKIPTCYDCYFPYAMSLIRSTVKPTDYTKVFVANIGFDFERTSCSEFTFLSTSKRFGLPENYTKLIEELRDDFAINICQSDIELQQFKSVYEQMKDYIADPIYLTEVLKVSISHLNLNNNFDIEEIIQKEIRV